MVKMDKAVPKCDSCGRTKNSFADLRRMTRKVNGRIDTVNVCAATFTCRDKKEREGYRG